MRIKVLFALAALLAGVPTTDAVSEPAASLATPESFASIADPAARSAAMFVELGKVLTDPRCVNCPRLNRPRAAFLFSPNSEAVCEIGARGRAPRIRGHCSSAAPVA